jgi:hypothetical protein
VADAAHLEAARKLLGLKLEKDVVLALREEGDVHERRLDMKRALGSWRVGRHGAAVGQERTGKAEKEMRRGRGSSDFEELTRGWSCDGRGLLSSLSLDKLSVGLSELADGPALKG